MCLTNSIQAHSLHCYHPRHSTILSLLGYGNGLLTGLFASAFPPPPRPLVVCLQPNSQRDAFQMYVKSYHSTSTLQRLSISLRGQCGRSHNGLLHPKWSGCLPAPLTLWPHSSSLLSLFLPLLQRHWLPLLPWSYTKQRPTAEPLRFCFLCLNHSSPRYHITFSVTSSPPFFQHKLLGVRQTW